MQEKLPELEKSGNILIESMTFGIAGKKQGDQKQNSESEDKGKFTWEVEDPTKQNKS